MLTLGWKSQKMEIYLTFDDYENEVTNTDHKVCWFWPQDMRYQLALRHGINSPPVMVSTRPDGKHLA